MNTAITEPQLGIRGPQAEPNVFARTTVSAPLLKSASFWRVQSRYGWMPTMVIAVRLMTRIESRLANTTIASFDAASALRYGELRADLQLAGALIGDADTRIAAIALANDLTMVTANVRHFERVAGLAVENWLV